MSKDRAQEGRFKSEDSEPVGQRTSDKAKIVTTTKLDPKMKAYVSARIKAATYSVILAVIVIVFTGNYFADKRSCKRENTSRAPLVDFLKQAESTNIRRANDRSATPKQRLIAQAAADDQGEIVRQLVPLDCSGWPDTGREDKYKPVKIKKTPQGYVIQYADLTVKVAAEEF